MFFIEDTVQVLCRVVGLCDRELGENLTDDELRSMIDEFDKDGDGESTYSGIIRLIS